LSLSALGVTNQACWVALFADFARTLRVDFREKSETRERSQTVSIGPLTSGEYGRVKVCSVSYAAPGGRLAGIRPPLRAAGTTV
jgi:hypothetical protein